MSVPEFVSLDQQQRRRWYSKTKGSLTMSETTTHHRRASEPVPDLTDFMNDMFFGTAHVEKKAYDLTGRGPSPGPTSGPLGVEKDEIGFDDSTRSSSARLTVEWLEEARRIVAATPSRRNSSPSRLFGSLTPRFAASQPPSPNRSSDNDALSRSARRNREAESISGQILSRSASHTRNHSSMPLHKWFSILETPSIDTSSYSSSSSSSSSSTLPPRHSLPPKSRFQTQSSQNVSDPSNGRFLSKSNSLPLSPPKKLVESAHRRTISSSTCSLERITSRPAANGWSRREDGTQTHCLNGFLKEQRTLIQKILKGELNENVKIVLSAPSNSTASMVAAICYAWLLGYRQRESGDGREYVVVPVINVKRDTMWNLKQAAWLFYHAGIDATSLLFADELDDLSLDHFSRSFLDVDMESIRMTGQLSVLVIGQDILCTTGEVGSQCTLLTDNYCEDAYDLLQDPVLKKLLLAGILLDTQNLKSSASLTTTRDSEAVQLLSVDSAPNYRYTLFDQLMLDQNATSFLEALHHSYGKHPDESDRNDEGNMERTVLERKSTSTPDGEVIIPSPIKNSTDTESVKTDKDSLKSAKLTSHSSQAPTPAAAQAEKEPSQGKNPFFIFKWFGFGSK